MGRPRATRMDADRLWSYYVEQGITHLKEVHAQLANGNVRARAQIRSGELLSLAGSFNLMAGRLLRTERADNYVQRLTKALNDLSSVLEQRRAGNLLRLPPSYREFPEIRRLLQAIGVSETLRVGQHMAANTGAMDREGASAIQKTPVPPARRKKPVSPQSATFAPSIQNRPLAGKGQRLQRMQEAERER